jgi:hypothetical protein
VHTKDRIVYQAGNGKAVKKFVNEEPESRVPEFRDDFGVETVLAVDLPRFVIAPKQMKAGRGMDLAGEQKTDRLEAEMAAIHVVPKKEIVRARIPWNAAGFKKPDEIEKLSVNVVANRNRGGENEQRSFHENDILGDAHQDSNITLLIGINQFSANAELRNEALGNVRLSHGRKSNFELFEFGPIKPLGRGSPVKTRIFERECAFKRCSFPSHRCFLWRLPLFLFWVVLSHCLAWIRQQIGKLLASALDNVTNANLGRE